MDNKELSKEINNSLIVQKSHVNPKCNLIKNNFIDNCKYRENTKLTLEYIYKNSECIKIYNEYFDCYKNDKRDKKINDEINISNR